MTVTHRLDLWVAHAAPAGGAGTRDLMLSVAAGAILLLAATLFGIAQRSGRVHLLNRWSERAGRISTLPGWAALPAGVAGGSLLVAVFGFYWDVATHIDNGRDAGPFANPAHYLIILGLIGIAGAGYLGVLLGVDANSKSGVRIHGSWRAPAGSLLLLAFGTIAILGFPLDDIWHRLFGQDVTLWGPTHLQMIGGASLSTLGVWILLVEGSRASRASGANAPRRVASAAEVAVAGAFLMAMSTFQAEFDYSVPQFRLLFHPLLLVVAAGIALVPARIRLGRGGALKAVAVFIALRAVLSATVGPLLGHTTLHFPLYVGEALVVELLAQRVRTDRAVTFGALAGTGIGIVGLGAEWIWSHLWMVVAWPNELLPEAVIVGLPAATAAGVLGGFIGRSLAEPAPTGVRAEGKHVGAAAAVVLVACLAYPLPLSTNPSGRAHVTLSTPNRDATRVTLRLDPPALADDAEWFNVTSWQGGGSVVASLNRIGPGVYRTDRPIHIRGDWKSLVRLHSGSAIVAVPIYMPEDRAIPAAEIPAHHRFARRFVPDKQVLLREAKETAPWLSCVSYSVVLLIACFLVVAAVWALGRLTTSRSGATKQVFTSGLQSARPRL